MIFFANSNKSLNSFFTSSIFSFSSGVSHKSRFSEVIETSFISLYSVNV